MKMKQRLIILSGVLVVIAVFLGFGVISSTVKLFGGTSNNTINNNYEEEIRLGDTTTITGCATYNAWTCPGNLTMIGTKCYESASYFSSESTCTDSGGTWYGDDCYMKSSTERSRTCASCASGYYKDGNSCKQCPFAYRDSQAGISSINACYGNIPAGKHVIPTTGNVLNCPAGSTSEAHTAYYGIEDNCTMCGDEMYSEDGISCKKCSDLTDGYYCNGHVKTKCNGSVSQNNMSCAVCTALAGEYCENGTTDIKKCPAGFKCSGGNAAPEECADDEYSNRGTNTCFKCKNLSGKQYCKSDHTVDTCNGAVNGTHTSCSNRTCPTGYPYYNSSNDRCYKEVEAGSYISNTSTGKEEKCPAGSYSITHNAYEGTADRCASCSNGQYSNSGSSSCSDCNNLGDKQYCTSSHTVATCSGNVNETHTSCDTDDSISLSCPMTIEEGNAGSCTMTAQSGVNISNVISSDSSVVSASKSSNTEVSLNGKGSGTATITVTASNGKTATATVSVIKCTITATNVPGYKHMSHDETVEVRFTISSGACDRNIEVTLRNFDGEKNIIPGVYSYKVTSNQCTSGSIKGCIKGTNICSDTITMELRPDWSNAVNKTVPSVLIKTYDNAPKSASDADQRGLDYYYELCERRDEKKGIYVNCVYHYRGCGGGGASSAVPHCYVKGDDYQWSYTQPSGYTLVSDITKEENCKKEETPACYEYNGEYSWGKHAKDDGYTLITSVKDEASCVKPIESYACYKKDTDYIWSTTAPDGYTLVSGVDNPKACTGAEQVACYLHGSEFVWGMYKNVSGYIYLENVDSEEKCKYTNATCYKDKNGNYEWGDYSDNDGYEIVPGVTSIDECAPEVPTPITDLNVSKLIYVFMTILMAFGIGFIYYASVLKKNN